MTSCFEERSHVPAAVASLMAPPVPAIEHWPLRCDHLSDKPSLSVRGVRASVRTKKSATFLSDALVSAFDPVVIEAERPGDAEARESLLDRAFGPARFRKTCHVLRAGRLPARGLSLVARHGGEVVGTVRLWHVSAGGVPALMLGPLAVDQAFRSHGIGVRLMEEALAEAKARGHGAVLLVGDVPYYAKFGFSGATVKGLRLPGPVERERFLGLELNLGVFAEANGLVRGTGATDMAARRSGHRPMRHRLTRAA